MIIEDPAPFSENQAFQLNLSSYLAAHSSRCAVTIRLRTSCDVNTFPSPITAAPISTKNIYTFSFACHTSRHVFDGQIRDWDTCGRIAGGAAVLIVLLDHDAVFRNVGEGDGIVGKCY